MAMITIVGCGPGALDYLTPIAHRAIKDAEVVVGARRLLNLLPTLDAEQIEVGTDIVNVLDSIAARAGRASIAVLVTGDPGVCSFARPVIRRFGRENCRVIPGISSLQVAFARLGVDWFGACLLTAHERIPNPDVNGLLNQDKIAILAGNTVTTPWIAGVAETLANTHTAFVCQDLTLPGEQVRSIAAEELAGSMLPSRTVVVFVRKELLW